MSSAELVDVVDAQDRVVGRASRGEVRARRLRHRATYLLVFNGRGELFIHLRTADKDIYPSYGTSPSAASSAPANRTTTAPGASSRRGRHPRRRSRGALRLAHEDERNCVHGRVYRVVWDGPWCCRRRSRARRMAAARRRRERMRREPFCLDGVVRSSASSS
jgi:isopentenyldiphosphate isomerase